jgi:hypothetical protein
MGRAINKAVAIGEIVKRRVEGLHQVSSGFVPLLMVLPTSVVLPICEVVYLLLPQVTEMGTMTLIDLYEPKEESPDLSPLEVSREVAVSARRPAQC